MTHISARRLDASPEAAAAPAAGVTRRGSPAAIEAPTLGGAKAVRRRGSRDAAESSAGRFLVGAASGLTLAQCARLVTGLLWLGWADWWYQQASTNGVPLVAMVQTVAAVTIMALAVTIHSERGTRLFDAALILGTLLGVALVGLVASRQAGYGTDELALGQAAASKLIRGVNPYVTDFTSSLQSFGSGTTMTLHGTVVTTASYPSLSFLLYVPVVALMGDYSYAGMVVDMLAWVAAGAILWRLMSPAVRPWVPIFLAVPVLFQAIVFGTTDPLYVPLELIAVCCWDRFADPKERSIARWVGPVALGLACSIKQAPWLIAPFLLAGVALEAKYRGQDWRRIALRYFATSAGIFLLPNLPFILWNPGRWLAAVLLPFTAALAPMGIGPIGLLRAYSIGGGNLSMFSVAAAAALIAVLVLYLRHYHVLRRVIPVLPLIALFVSTRSLSSYFGFCVPALAVSAASLRTGVATTVSRRITRPMTSAAFVLAATSVGFLAAGLAWPAPLRVSVTSSRLAATSLSASVTVANASDRTVTPHFILAKGPSYQQAMQVVDGPAQLPPHSTSVVNLTTQLGVNTPHAGEPFQVQVATTSPDTFSSSAVVSVATAAKQSQP